MLNDGAKTSKGLAPEVLKEALKSANVPTLILVLTQMTGDDRWLGPPYQLSRNRGLDDNDSGGLSAELQEEVRAAAFEAGKTAERWRCPRRTRRRSSRC